MDELGGFEPTDTTGFIQIESIRIRKYVGYLSSIRLPLNSIIDGVKLTSPRGRPELVPKTCMAPAFNQKTKQLPILNICATLFCGINKVSEMYYLFEQRGPN